MFHMKHSQAKKGEKTMRTNNNYINNATLATINSFARVIADAFGGKVTRNDTIGKDNNVLSDESISKYHEAIYMTRVEFSEERHNALEVTATATQFYVTFGDTVSDDVAKWVRSGAEKEERKPKWNLKNKCYYNIDEFKKLASTLVKNSTTTKKSATTKAKATTKKSAKSA